MNALRTSTYGAFVAALLLLVASCGSSAPKRPGAAEPATAPATSAAPVGPVVPVGESPEGIVFDPVTKLVAVAVRNPDRLLLLDPDTLALRRTVPLPGSVRHLQLARPGGPVLVPAESANQLVEVTLPAGATRATDVLKQPHDATAAADGDLVVGNEFGKSISVVRDGIVRATVRDLKQPGGVIGYGHDVAVVDVGAFTLSTYDLPTARRTAIVPAGKGPTHGELLSGDRVAVSDTRGDAILVYRLAPLTPIGRLALPGTPYGLAVDATTDTLWVTLTARNQVVGLDLSGPTPQIIARYATVRQPNTVAVAPGSHRLWITGTDDGVVQLIRR
ncbi:MAG TPA: hypothetical protein VGN18_15025 [Jatrophihabitans sp.]|jgi:hypothetical protein|uniref:YncE family protein n=1 Tax=Jatrophihabitans sp. TaxID=1932789 RepID=UPI002E024FC5|nr:hypothetical protein [Jatrophihabitans sp.]